LLTVEELERYDRQILVKGVGLAGQEEVKGAQVMIAGTGGLGSSIALYLVAAGVGTIRLVDRDAVTLSNLNRQVLHWTSDLGRRKVVSAKEKLTSLNPFSAVEAIDLAITEVNAAKLVADCDLVVDALDNLESRFFLNKAAVNQGKPLFHGAVRGFEGRVMTVIPGKTACLRCVYRGVRPEEKLPVVGATPAVIGSLQATEVLKYLLGVGRLLIDRLVVYDGLNMRFTELSVQKDPNCPHCGTFGKQGDE
jgi:molybdopterin-synthase adenylyltransferase